MQQRVVWSGAWFGSSSGQFRRPFSTKSALSVWFRALCEFDLWHFNLWTKLSRRQLLQATKSIFCSPSWTRARWGCEEKALYFPEYFEQFGASFGILCMSRSCWLRQDSLLFWMPNQAAASIFFGFFRFFAVLFGLAVFKFFSLVAVVRRQEETSLWIQFYPQKFGFVAYVVFCCCCGCCCCCCYSVYLSICRVRVRECVRECECVLGMCGRLSGYQRWHKSFIYQPQLVLLAGVLGAPCLMNTHKVANEATSRKSGKGSAHTHTHPAIQSMYVCIYIHMYVLLVGIYEYIHKTA